MRLLPIFLFLAVVSSAVAANQVKLVQLGYKEACEEDGNGKFNMAVDIGSIKAEDGLQSYELAISYKDQPVRITLPALFVNTLTEQIPQQYRSFSNDGENGVFFGSAALITGSSNGIAGDSYLIGFWITDLSGCSEPAEVKITQFYVNEECKLDFEIDSVYEIEQRMSEKFISELTASSQISSLTLDKDEKSGEIQIEYQIDDARKIDYSELSLKSDTLLETEISFSGTADSTAIAGDTLRIWGLDGSGGSLASVEYSYLGDSTKNDSLAVSWDLLVDQECGCARAADTGGAYEIIHKGEIKGSVFYTMAKERAFHYEGSLVSDTYKGRLTIVSVTGRTETIEDFRSGTHTLGNGVYILVKEKREIEKLIVNSF